MPKYCSKKNCKCNESITVLTESSKDNREIVIANSNLQHILTKRSQAEIQYYGNPDQNSDVFRRRINCIKINKKSVTDTDIPDIEDVYETDLPWVGCVSFNGASRQFRSKNAVAVAVDMVRQFDGFLYQISVDIRRTGDDHSPIAYVTSRVGLTDTYRKFNAYTDLTEKELSDLFSYAKAVPEGLIRELTGIGYVFDGKDSFTIPGQEGINAKLHCRLFGKILPLRCV